MIKTGIVVSTMVFLWLGIGIIGVIIAEYVEWRYGNWLFLPTKKNGNSFKETLLEVDCWFFAFLGPIFLMAGILAYFSKLISLAVKSLLK